MKNRVKMRVRANGCDGRIRCGRRRKNGSVPEIDRDRMSDMAKLTLLIFLGAVVPVTRDFEGER
jgi:hypothetical protein